MKIGILQTGHGPDELLEDLGDYDALFRNLLNGHGFDFTTWNVVDNEFPENARDADGWIVTGSRHGAYEDHDWIPPLETLIREIRDLGQPMLGICFGHQIIAQALGGKVEKFQGGWSIGRTEYDVGGKTIALNAWHQDQVTELPEGATVLGSSDFCRYAVLGYGDSIWTVQPHPEFGSEFIDGLIRTRGQNRVPQDLLDTATAALQTPTDRLQVAGEMAEFLKRGQA